MDNLILRTATPADLSAVDALLARSYPRLLKSDYPPSVLVSAVPIISRARPELLASGRYFVVMEGDRALGAGGYSFAPPSAAGAESGPGSAGFAHIRHVATDPDATRRGIGRALMQRIFASAADEGLTRFDCMSTRTAVPFYAALGFRTVGEIEVTLSPGVVFPAVRMIRP